MTEALQVGAERETDYRAAVKVMGWTPYFVDRAHPIGPRLTNGPLHALDYYDGPDRRVGCGWSPTTDIAAAWEVVEAMEAKGWRVFLTNESGQWNVGFARQDGGGESAFAHHITAPLAICRAALAAVGATPTPTPAPTPEQGPSL